MSFQNPVFIPGPTNIPENLRKACDMPTIDHRSPLFGQILHPAREGVRKVLKSDSAEVFIFPSTGTGGWETALTNCLSAGDKVLSARNGMFSHRWIDMCQRHGLDVQIVETPWGEGLPADRFEEILTADTNHEIKAVLATHNETSTGVTHPLQQISEVVKGEFQKLLLVDAVSSLACVPLPVDGWNCDVVGTASQKGFMIPPGLAFITMSETAWEACETSTMPSFYFDLKAARSYLERGQTPFTPNVALMYGLITALDKLLEEGMENVYERHVRISQITRDGIKDLGLDLLVSDEAYASNTVTAIKVPEGVDGGRLRSLVREEHNVVLAGGQGKLSGSIFRIGHLGHVTREDIEEVLETLKTVLPKVGFRAG